MTEQPQTPAALRHSDWTAVRQAAYQTVSPLPPHWLPPEETAGETLTEDLRAERPVPHYTSSAMDGWGVNGPAPWRINRGQLEEVDQRVAWAHTEEPWHTVCPRDVIAAANAMYTRGRLSCDLDAESRSES